MNSKKIFLILFLLFFLIISFIPCQIFAQDIFIWRPDLNKKNLSEQHKIFIHGEYFVQLQSPCTFPSYNDLSGPEDRWNYGFQNRIFFTRNTSFLGQLITHDDGGRRTKFDWHFSLRHSPFENLVFIIGHDSNHDSDFQSHLNQKSFYLNRNYIGFGIPFQTEALYVEPFTWFLHHTNHKGHLDFSGEKLRQEYGIRLGLRKKKFAVANLQVLSQSEKIFSLAQTIRADLIIRIKLLDYFELSLGTSLWKDITESRLENKKYFYKFIWGIAIPF